MNNTNLPQNMPKRCLAFLVLMLTLVGGLSAAPAGKLHQSLDSAYILMGKKTLLNIELTSATEPDGSILFDAKRFPAEVEAEPLEPVVEQTAQGRWRMSRQILLQSFDSGMYTLPRAIYVSRAGDTLQSNPLALKVIPVPVDTMTDIHGYQDIILTEGRWNDFLPDWVIDYWVWILLAAAVIAGAILAWRQFGPERLQAALVPKPKPRRPAHEVALEELEQMRSEHPETDGTERQFYTHLTEILRVYLHDRFGINAMEMTTAQIMHALDSSQEARLSRQRMDQILRMADFVKFAKVRPLPEDNTRMLSEAISFVEDTRPVEVEPQTPQKP